MKAVLRERIPARFPATDGAHLGTWRRIAAKAADMPDWLLQRETLLTIEAGARQPGLTTPCSTTILPAVCTM